MRIAVLADIHANLPALNAVRQDLEKARPPVEQVWFLGDLFGYGPFPLQVFSTLQEMQPDVWLAGNNDLGLAGISPFTQMNIDARIRETWRLNRLGLVNEAVEYVAARPRQDFKDIEGMQIYLVHGFPAEQEEDRTTIYDFQRAPLVEFYNGGGGLSTLLRCCIPDVQIVIVGHSHQRAGWRWNGRKWGYLSARRLFGTTLEGRRFDDLNNNGNQSVCFSLRRTKSTEKNIYILNPGSVGMPNDGCGEGDRWRHAKYMLLDILPDAIAMKYRTVAYDVKELQESWKPYPPSIRDKLNLE